MAVLCRHARRAFAFYLLIDKERPLAVVLQRTFIVRRLRCRPGKTSLDLLSTQVHFPGIPPPLSHQKQE